MAAIAATNEGAGRLLVVDDDPELRDLLRTYLERQGFQVVTVADGVAMDAELAASRPDLIVLDLMLPGEDGLSIAKRIRAAGGPPIIILSAQGDDVDRIVGLEVGADDYVGKPFNPRELLARIRAVLRRIQAAAERPPETDSVLRFGDYTLDLLAHRLRRGDETVALTTGEYELLVVLAQHPNRVLDRDRILELLTGEERSPVDRSIDVRVTRLRAKIEVNPQVPRYIKTIWGKGYLFSPDGA
jgi:two-component system phosphate regulon response regulator OmpR